MRYWAGLRILEDGRAFRPAVLFQRRRALYLILLLAFVLRTYHLADPPWDYHNWRQTITSMVARDFNRHGFPLLHPQVLWIGGDRPADPSYFSGEFSIQSVVAAFLYKALGESDTIARLIVIGFSLLGIYFLYHLLERNAGSLAAALGTLIYSLFPYEIFFGRAFMPDVPALALALGGLNVLDRWTSTRTWGALLAAAGLTSLALLQKLTVVCVVAPMIYLFWLALGRRLLSRFEPYVFAIIAGVPSLLWYRHSAALAGHSGFAIMVPDLVGSHLGQWLKISFVGPLLKTVAIEAFTLFGFVLVVLGFFLARGRGAWIFRLWFTAAAFLLVFMPDILRGNHYYLLLLLPGGAALAGMALASLAPSREAYPLLALVLIAFAGEAIHAALPLYGPDRWPYELGSLLNRLTTPQELVVTESGGSPNMLYFADRRGWMLDREYDVHRVEQSARAGARYYADTFRADHQEHSAFFQGLDARFERLTPDNGPWPIYDLAASFSALHEVPAGEIPNPQAVKFGDKIQLRGIALRKLLDRPAAYDVTCYWECLQEQSTNLRMLVQVTRSSGQIVDRQDRWPRGGHMPTSTWRARDILRDRYVLVLPESLSGGEYQIRLGWYDPTSAQRPSDEHATTVASVEVRRPSTYRWFSSK